MVGVLRACGGGGGHAWRVGGCQQRADLGGQLEQQGGGSGGEKAHYVLVGDLHVDCYVWKLLLLLVLGVVVAVVLLLELPRVWGVGAGAHAHAHHGLLAAGEGIIMWLCEHVRR